MSAYPFQSPYGYVPQMYAQPRQEFMPAQRNVPIQAPPAEQQSGGFFCRPVTSKAAAEVAQIPFDGSTAWFYDTAADVMYAKTFNFADGTAPIVTYVREVVIPKVQYATKEDIQSLREEIDRLKKLGKVEKNESEPDE